MSDTEHRWDKLALFILAGLIIIVIGLVVLGVFLKGVPEKGDAVLGGIVTGLLLFLRDLVTAVRTSWEGQQWGKMADNLAAAPATVAPDPTPDPDIPQKVEVINEKDHPVPTVPQKV